MPSTKKVPREVHSLYDGEIELSFLESKHWYQIGDTYVPSVTSITGVMGKDALMYWGINMTIEYINKNLKVGFPIDEISKAKMLRAAKTAHRMKSEEALDVGSAAHAWVEQYIGIKIARSKEALALPVNGQVRNAVEAFLDWETQHQVTYRSSERKVYSRRYNFAGTLDIEAVVDGALRVADIKTSKEIYPEYRLQCSAYKECRQEESGEEFGESLIIRIPKDGGEVEVFEEYDHDTTFQAFKACLVLYRAQKKMERDEKDRSI